MTNRLMPGCTTDATIGGRRERCKCLVGAVDYLPGVIAMS